CGADRAAGQRGRCHETDTVRIARASLHPWEEPCLSGTNGAGTVFFTGCPLGCVYCQNYDIADGSRGTALTSGQLTDVFLRLQDLGAHNIDLVTPTHFVPQIVPALERAKAHGLRIPVVYNTGTYETVDTLRMLESLVDVWLPDVKYVSPELSARYSDAPDYFDVAAAALEEMVRQAPACVFDDAGLMIHGVLVRHLVLPGCTEDSKAVLKYLYETYGDRVWLSIMSQFTPVRPAEGLDRPLTRAEYDAVVDFATDLGISNAFVQEGEAASESFIPDFEHFDLEAFLSRETTLHPKA
ncbi:MAG: radical SAM protein, partial [Clostridia bacterium]|nr:radical SAM protein [Clostridia bacterium]